LTKLKALVIGGSGRVGKALMAELAHRGIQTQGTYLTRPFYGGVRLDICDTEQTNKVITNDLDVVFVTAAETNVDKCEKQGEANTEGFKNVINACALWKTQIVYFSTDFVFKGEGSFHEWDLVSPVSEYGRQKVYAEHMVLSLSNPNHLIIRTSWLFDEGHNFVTWVAKELKAGKTISLPTDQCGNPTYSLDLAKTVVDIWMNGLGGIWHVCGKDNLSRFELGELIKKLIGKGQVIPIEKQKQIAQRPLGLVLATEKLKKIKLGLDSLAHLKRIVDI